MYALFGIFDMHMDVIYGEGKKKALKRLREKVHENHLYLVNLLPSEPHGRYAVKERTEPAKSSLPYYIGSDNPVFNRWRQQPESHLLWIRADAGKSLQCGIIDKKEPSVTTDQTGMIYVLYQAASSRIDNTMAVLRGLAYLHGYLQPHLHSHQLEYAASHKILMELLFTMLNDQYLGGTCVVDALDELGGDCRSFSLALMADLRVASHRMLKRTLAAIR